MNSKTKAILFKHHWQSFCYISDHRIKLCHSLSWMLTERWLNCRDMPISHISVIFQSHFTSLSGTVSSCGQWFSPRACSTKLCCDGEMQDVLCQCVGELYKIVSLSATACCTYCQRNGELYNVSARRRVVVKWFVTRWRLVAKYFVSVTAYCTKYSATKIFTKADSIYFLGLKV